MALPADDQPVIQAVKDKTDRGVYGKPLRATSEGAQIKYGNRRTQVLWKQPDDQKATDNKTVSNSKQLEFTFFRLGSLVCPRHRMLTWGCRFLRSWMYMARPTVSRLHMR